MMKFAQALRRMRQEERGFTLVELMVVVVIIGVLAAVAIPKFSGIIDNSKQKSDIATGKVIKDAVDRYYTDNGAYPANLAALTDGTTQYLSSTPTVAQGNGTAAATNFAASDGTGGVFFVDTDSGQVTVHEVTSSSTISATLLWDSNS